MAWENNRPTHVPTKVREACLERDGNRCVEHMRDGTRCHDTRGLQAAHITGWTPGEVTTVDMVRTLCAWHHNRETQREAQAARKPTFTSKRPTAKHPGLK